MSGPPIPGTVDAPRPPLLVWPLSLGALGFAAGFFGPLVFSPEANQGPLLGILITGPGGALLGLVLGAAVRLLRLPVMLQWQLLFGTCAVLMFGTLHVSLPEPRPLGYVVEGEIRTCKPSAQALDRAMRHWTRVLEGTAARSGWQSDARSSAQVDPGVVLEVYVARMISIDEHRKPWNRGRITAGVWRDVGEVRRYYARYAGGACANYPAGARSLLYVPGPSATPAHDPREWPPTSDMAAFLGLRVLVPVPDQYRRLIERPSGR